MKDYNALVSTALSSNPEDKLRAIITELRQEVADLTSGDFQFSEVVAVVETAVKIYAEYGSLPKEEIPDLVTTLLEIMDQDMGLIQKLDDLVDLSKVPVVGGMLEAMDDTLMRFIIFKIVVPLAVKAIK